jgi:hypothetical protein
VIECFCEVFWKSYRSILNVFEGYKNRFIKPLDGELKVAQKSRKDMKIESIPKNTRQGDGRNTKHSATSRNVARKKYRGQGR